MEEMKQFRLDELDIQRLQASQSELADLAREFGIDADELVISRRRTPLRSGNAIPKTANFSNRGFARDSWYNLGIIDFNALASSDAEIAELYNSADNDEHTLFLDADVQSLQAIQPGYKF